MADFIKRLSLRKKPKAAASKDGELPPPPKPGKNSWKIDDAFLETKIADDLDDTQVDKFRTLMGSSSLEFEPTMVNLGVAIELFDDYTADKKNSLDKSVSRYMWVFMTENPLGDQLRIVFEKLQEKKILVPSETGSTFSVADQAA
mmetsp:Transcript_12903/g.14816  ORF Transcript_12903/g.14816 Transcript_12903/m.14816 type:complete len:145 (+) Transcript_12903:232-666(+)|eukprot:CAMPEP_0184027946 /NCGR_PEP_ID=MMETSP0954-20121128/14507_1 /TAXON_ID=627963 /ORGANISM="Aplanochytrium sp, Strain PBS07" /LENGTH=144 /DNA_ID=CAMNT_0026312615 /DNA_START=233 /DNA_END=667 /DNA_ORIENTATION=-